MYNFNSGSMKVRNNYNECLTNLACSICKYFEIEYNHNTLNYVDEVLNKYQPQNVVTVLCDGMGYNILKRCLDSNSFLVKNCLKKITTVFPATTVAATTSMITGLNPYETGMLGWDMYFKEIDKIITTFLSSDKDDGKHVPLKEAIDYKKKYLITTPITSILNENGKYHGYHVSPYGDIKYKKIDEMFDIIKEKCYEKGKKYIYAYYDQPDSTMHELGCDVKEAYQIIKDLNNRFEELSRDVKDTIVFVVADHGHCNINNLFIDDYPDINQCLIRKMSIESRAVNFFIKEDKKELFEELFKKYFGNDFDLYDKEDVISSKLFGDGKENVVFRDILGDYLAIAKTNKALIHYGSNEFKSQHAGYTDDEIFVPLILIKTSKE